VSEIQFNRNFNDLCVNHGVNAGFQFEFYCERCSSTWRSEFAPYRSGQASDWINRAGSMLGGIFGNVGNAVDGLAQAGYGSARDEEFKKAVAQAEHHFHRCGKCHRAVCDPCWNVKRGLCLDCAPDVNAAVEAAKAQGEIDAASEAAAEEGRARGAKVEVKRDRQLVCPKCKAETHGAKFCPECGEKLAVSGQCPECQAEMPAGAKFCPECGHKAG
jgi:hypothetical protein